MHSLSGELGGVKIVDNGQSFYISPNRVVDSLRQAHRKKTGETLNTNFAQRNDVFLTDFGFVLKFKKVEIQKVKNLDKLKKFLKFKK